MKQMNKKFLRGMTRLFVVVFGIALLVVIAEVAIAQPQPPMPVTIQGIVTYEDGSYVPSGWNVTLWNLDEDFAGVAEPWTGKTGFFPPIYNYTVVGSATASSTFKIDVQGDNYRGSRTFDASPFGFYIINITVSPTGITPIPPVKPLWGLIIGIIIAVIIIGAAAYYFYTKKKA